MRLLDCDLAFHEFSDEDDRPAYLILSHTWDKDEVTYQNMMKWQDLEYFDSRHEIEKKKGFEKIRKMREFVQHLPNISFFWVDTCCIDKSSSAELSESINSMYRWYQNAAECIVWLSDVTWEQEFKGIGYVKDDIRFMPTPDQATSSQWIKVMSAAKWFTRGWTLQELIAPKIVHFYDSTWLHLGGKERRVKELSSITGIPGKPLLYGEIRSRGIAAKFSWAAKRQTSRKEDLAYCLLGIFDINMPLLYGEGSRAFQRLQEEILKVSSDMSIFCWVSDSSSFGQWSSLLASGPADYQHSGNIVSRYQPQSSFSLTNKGLRIHGRTLHGHNISFGWEDSPGESSLPAEIFLDTECEDKLYRRGRNRIYVRLMRISEESYVRVDPNQLFPMKLPAHGGVFQDTDLIVPHQLHRMKWTWCEGIRLAGFRFPVGEPQRFKESEVRQLATQTHKSELASIKHRQWIYDLHISAEWRPGKNKDSWIWYDAAFGGNTEFLSSSIRKVSHAIEVQSGEAWIVFR
jgi:Heterokaryon incompatibility protein (HET)